MNEDDARKSKKKEQNDMRKTTTWMVAVAVCAMMTIGCNRNKINLEGMQTYVDSVPEELPIEPVQSEVPGDTIASSDSTATAKADTMPASKEEVTEPVVYKKVYAKSDDGYVNVRSQPTVKSEALGRLTVGGPGAKYLATEGEWTKIEYKGREAYVKSCYATTDSLASMAKTKPTAEAKPVNNGKLYYVVIASFSELERAKKTTDGLSTEFKSPVYKYQTDGKAMFRICESCFDTKAKAEARIKHLNQRFGKSDLWVWETDGKMSCVYCPVASDGKRMTPLIPR